MIMAIKSIKRSSGTYEGRDYDNTLVFGFVLNSNNEQILCGEEVEICKFKTPVFAEALDRNIKALDDPNIKGVADLAGLLFTPVYNKFGGCDDFMLAAAPGKK